MKIMSSYYTEEQKTKIRELNKDYVNDLRNAITNHQVSEFFASFGFKPRFTEIIEIVLCFPDGESIIYDLYDLIFTTISDVHVPAVVEKLVEMNRFHPLLKRDFNNLLERSITSSNLLTNNIINFIEAIMQIPDGDSLVIPKLDSVFNILHPTLITHTIMIFEGQSYFNEMVKNNYIKWLPLTRGNATIDFVKLLLTINKEEAIEYIKNNFTELLKNSGGGMIYALLNILADYPELISTMQANVLAIIKSSHSGDINSIIVDLDERLNLGILKNNDIIIYLKERLSFDKQGHLAVGAIIKSGKNDYLKSILNKMLEAEGVSDFSSIGDNSWSNIVFKVGNKVLKLGWIRNNPNCDSHYRLIEPDKYEIICDEFGNPILYIEIQDFLSQDDISKEDIEDFYADLDSDGYIYIDPKGNNVTNFGISKREYSEIAKVSESFKKKALVLIDRDCVWKKGDPNIKYMDRY